MQQIKITIPHFYCLEYSEGEKKLLVDIDFRETKIIIGRSLIKHWEKPYDSEKLTEEKREEIYINIKKYILRRFSYDRLMEIE